MFANVNASSPVLADIGNNIFWENHDLTASPQRRGDRGQHSQQARAPGQPVLGQRPERRRIRPMTRSTWAAASTRPPSDPRPTSSATSPAIPAFVAARRSAPRCRRPGEFFQDANFDLTANSAAIDAALPSIARPSTSSTAHGSGFAGRGFPGTGPADVGAFEFNGTGGIAVGGAFRVASTSLAAGGAALASGSPVTASQLGNVDHGRLLRVRQSELGHTRPTWSSPAAVSTRRTRCTRPASPGSTRTPSSSCSRATSTTRGPSTSPSRNGTIQSVDHQTLRRLLRLGPDRQLDYRRRPTSTADAELEPDADPDAPTADARPGLGPDVRPQEGQAPEGHTSLTSTSRSSRCTTSTREQHHEEAPQRLIHTDLARNRPSPGRLIEPPVSFAGRIWPAAQDGSPPRAARS